MRIKIYLAAVLHKDYPIRHTKIHIFFMALLSQLANWHIALHSLLISSISKYFESFVLVSKISIVSPGCSITYKLYNLLFDSFAINSPIRLHCLTFACRQRQLYVVTIATESIITREAVHSPIDSHAVLQFGVNSTMVALSQKFTSDANTYFV